MQATVLAVMIGSVDFHILRLLVAPTSDTPRDLDPHGRLDISIYPTMIDVTFYRL